jgi:hypothetical protein
MALHNNIHKHLPPKDIRNLTIHYNTWRSHLEIKSSPKPNKSMLE